MITLLDASVDEVLAACLAIQDCGRAGGSVRGRGSGRVGARTRRHDREWAAAEGLLDQVDLEAVSRRQHLADARRALASRAALRLLVASRLGVPSSLASQVIIDRTCSCGLPHGRPRVAGLSVSTSSSSGRVLVAVADEGTEVGVDIERVPRELFDGFDDFVLHPSERRRLLTAPRAVAVTATDDATTATGDQALLADGATVGSRLTCWVEKEAVLKAVGLGLASPPDQVLVSPRPEGHVLPSSPDMVGPWEWREVVEAGAPEALGLSVTELATQDGYRCAIAARVPSRIRAVTLGTSEESGVSPCVVARLG